MQSPTTNSRIIGTGAKYVDRREAKKEFKSGKIEQDMFAVRCAAGPIWVGSSRDLKASHIGTWLV
jgi:hypothetical protein